MSSGGNNPSGADFYCTDMQPSFNGIAYLCAKRVISDALKNQLLVNTSVLNLFVRVLRSFGDYAGVKRGYSIIFSAICYLLLCG